MAVRNLVRKERKKERKRKETLSDRPSEDGVWIPQSQKVVLLESAIRFRFRFRSAEPNLYFGGAGA
jgi:hypothetical protein